MDRADREHPEYHPEIVVIAFRTVGDDRLLLVRRAQLPRWGTVAAGPKTELSDGWLVEASAAGLVVWSEHDKARAAFEAADGGEASRGSLLVACGPLTPEKTAAVEKGEALLAPTAELEARVAARAPVKGAPGKDAEAAADAVAVAAVVDGKR